jgi:hypothetical protein
MRTLHLTLGIVTLLGAALSAQHSMPAGLSHDEHLRQMAKDDALKHRGALAMGFDQDKTVHHFLLRRTGGAIVVTSKAANDADSIAQIRSHFLEIAESFGNGLFDKPVATHGELPPGAATMAVNKELLSYRYEERDGGAGVLIETADPATLQALHEFLRYQIVEHRTGDPLVVQR